MLISIQELELHRIDFREEIGPDVIDYGADIHQQSALRSAGHAELVEERRGHRGSIEDIRVVGDFATRLELNCARCLEPVSRDISGDFDLLYRPRGADSGVDERTVSGDEAEVSYYTGEGVLLEDVLREQVLLAVPLKTVCREDCRGLCPHCGRNLNFEQCNCSEPLEDPRWSALKEIKDKLQS
ncbi:MAG TPA: DUF177 domain-containing protein [Terriglobales bacterium]|nr:DUF177 domain-containing protein [Terriglobales bacterium]